MMDNDADIAIVGLACHFPGARDADEFWRNLAGGVESITRFGDEEMRAAGVPPEHIAASNYVKAGPVLDEPGAFDASFFGFVPSEARTMDPQQRLLLELAYTAIEDAGCDVTRFPGRVGVFAGAAMNTYFMHAGLKQNYAQEYIPTLIGTDKDFLSTRISYKLNLKGPSMTVQTACSTSLVAVHLARQSLLSEETDLALAGAISVRAPHRAGYFADGGGVSSPDARVRAFDAGANGTVFGSGGGLVVLKRLRDALADGDTIRAIIKGSAVNNDGSEKAGYTAPSVNSQADAIVEALANADVDAESISYIEAHGSGTPVGDPIEIRALTKAFRSSTQRTGFCAIGSVKTNVGHLDAAAGMAGLIKTVLALQHRQIPASLNFSHPNPEIDFPTTPFFVNTALASWPSRNEPRRAGVMSTGMGGTNAHLILEEAPPAAAPSESNSPKLFVLSARTDSALAASADRLRAFLETNPSTNLDDVAHTLRSGRQSMEHRRFIVAADRAALLNSLATKPKRLAVNCVDGHGKPALVLLLPGVGDHYVGMGRELYASFPIFRQEVDRCAEVLHPLLSLDIREVLYPPDRNWQASPGSGLDLKKMLTGHAPSSADRDTQRLNHAVLLQPVLFAIEYALARLWIDLGFAPQAIVGHSMGEYVAACLAGVFSLEDALRLIVRRTQLADQMPPAGMLAVTLSEAELQPLLPEDLSLALINGPSLCVVAGAPKAIAHFSTALAARGVLFRSVQNTHAFHSRLLEPMAAAFEAEVRRVRLNRPKIPFTSNVTGRWITDAEAVDPAYWVRHLTRTARFHEALRTAWHIDRPLFLECGPGKTLGVFTNQHPDKAPTETALAIPSLRHDYESLSDVAVFLNALGRLWLAGAEVSWEKLPTGQPLKKVPLPTYPFERQNYWLTGEPRPAAAQTPATDSDGGCLEIDRWFNVPSWERTPAIQTSPASSGILWLIFADRHGGEHGFRELLAGNGATPEVIHLGAALDVASDGATQIRPRHFDDYLHVFRRVKEATPTAVHIIHLGCLAPSEPPRHAEAAEAEQDFGFFSLLQIAQAVGELNIGIAVKIAIVSAGLHQVIGDEGLNPSMAPVLGTCGVIPKECSNVATFNIDLSFSGATASLNSTQRRWILSEFANAVPGEILAYRGSHRWKRKFVPVTLPGTSEVTALSGRLRERGVYLITGGTGGIGLAVARYLAQVCRGRIVLTKKSSFPEKAHWRVLAERPETPLATVAILRQLIEIEDFGGEVEVVVADVCDHTAMGAVLAETLAKFGNLHGVIHAAGIVRPGLAQTKTREWAESVLAPKVVGTWLLRDALAGVKLDFLVLCSSITAITTPFAESDYSGANAFLDAFAHFSQSECSYPVISINWPGWKEAGQLANLKPAAGTERWKEAALKKAIATRDGLEVFQRALSAGFPQIVISPTDLDQELRSSDIPHFGGGLQSESSAPPSSDIEGTVREVWSKAFGIESVGADEQFADLGGHSLLALQIVTRLRGLYDVEITLQEFFAASTVAQLCALIQEKLIFEIANLSDDEVRELINNASAPHA